MKTENEMMIELENYITTNLSVKHRRNIRKIMVTRLETIIKDYGLQAKEENRKR